MQCKITSNYIRDLAAVYHQIDNRGLLFDERIMSGIRYDISNKITQLLEELSFNWSCLVYSGANAEKRKLQDSLNIGSTIQLMAKLKALQYDIPKVRKKNKETYEVEYKESVEELVLRKIFAETGSSDIQRILEIRELSTLNIRYVSSKRLNGVFYSCYNTAGTFTGRRGCKKHTFGVGGNAQTFPKHYSKSSACYKAGQHFLQGIVARPGKLFFIVDQISAEDWPVNALAGNTRALDELYNQVDRHTILASDVFNIPINSRSSKEWKDSIERYLGKKCRHANNYGMRGALMSDLLAREGFAYTEKECQNLLDKVNEHDPSIDAIFHKFVRDSLLKEQTLRNPFGRECHFNGLRNNSPNHNVFNQAYSYIPQSTIADNTGFALFLLETQHRSFVVNECHDSIVQECDDNIGELIRIYGATQQAFDRKIRFHNGIEINVPIEGEIGYNFKDTIKIQPFTEEGLRNAYVRLLDEKAVPVC